MFCPNCRFDQASVVPPPVAPGPNFCQRGACGMRRPLNGGWLPAAPAAPPNFQVDPAGIAQPPGGGLPPWDVLPVAPVAPAIAPVAAAAAPIAAAPVAQQPGAPAGQQQPPPAPGAPQPAQQPAAPAQQTGGAGRFWIGVAIPLAVVAIALAVWHGLGAWGNAPRHDDIVVVTPPSPGPTARHVSAWTPYRGGPVGNWTQGSDGMLRIPVGQASAGTVCWHLPAGPECRILAWGNPAIDLVMSGPGAGTFYVIHPGQAQVRRP